MSVLGVFVFSFGCSSSESEESTKTDSEPGITIPIEVYKKIYLTTSDISISGGYVYINTNGVPDHKSPYFKDTKWHDDKYEAYDESNPNKFHTGSFNLNPNRVSELSLSFKIPATCIPSLKTCGFSGVNFRSLWIKGFSLSNFLSIW